MPKMTGVQFYEQAKKLQPDTIRILLTGYADIQSVVDAINSGEVYRYISKPWDLDDLKNTVRQGVEIYRLRKDVVNKSEEIKDRNEELETAYEDLKKLDQAKTQFLGLVSHELRTPLTTIVAYTESLLEGMARNKEEARRFYDHIFKGSLRLNEIVNDILDMTTFEAGKLILRPIKSDLSALMAGALLKLRDKAREKDLHINNLLGPMEGNVDEEQMGKVFIKVLDNAIKFTPPKGNITIAGKEDDDRLEIMISDDGVGIPEYILEDIFTPFVSQDILHHHRGMALSLPICKAIVEAHGGKIWAERLEIGTCIHIVIPKKIR